MASRRLLLLWVVIIPFLNAPFMAINLFNVSGLKLENLLILFMFAGFLQEAPDLRWSDRTVRYAVLSYFAYLAVFTYLILRALPNLATFHAEAGETFPSDTVHYLLTFYVRPVGETLPFLVVLLQMRSPADMQNLTNAIGVSLFPLSLAIIWVLVVLHPEVLGADRNYMIQTMSDYLGMHYNDLATIYFSLLPVVTFLALKRGGFWVLNLALALVCVLLLESRTGLIVSALAVAWILALFRRYEVLAAGAFLGFVLVLAKAAPSIAILLTAGVHHSEFTLDTLLSGREMGIWIPLLAQWLTDPSLLWFGAGAFAIMATPLWWTGSVVQAANAHNAFLDLFLDGGLVVLLPAVTAIVFALRRAIRIGAKLRNSLYWSLFACCACYLVGTTTGELLLPSYMNPQMFPLLALLLNVARYCRDEALRRNKAGIPARLTPAAAT